MKCPVLPSVLLLLVANASPAQTINWRKEQPTTPVPARRERHAIACDPARQRVVMFGGRSGGPVDDTWEWNGATWTEIKTTTKPPAREAHALVYHPGRKKVVLFGGWRAGSALADTWEWNGATWTEIRTMSNPPARYGHALVYDAARQRVVLFGGRSTARFDDTWVWDGKDWTEVKPRRRPPARAWHGLVYDAARSRVVLFGGRGSGFMDDTWEWDGAAWTNIQPTVRPMNRSGPSMAYDVVRQRVFLFGGAGVIAYGDTWEWNGAAWTRFLSTVSPPPRYGHALVYDEALQRIVLFGGNGAPGTLQDTWTLGAAGFSGYGSGCGHPIATLSPRSDSRIGSVYTLDAWNLSGWAQVAVLALGFSPRRVDLASIGMPGCWLLQSTDLLLLPNAGLTKFTMPIPNDPKLVGLKLRFQSIVVDPKANRAGLLTTNGAAVEVWK